MDLFGCRRENQGIFVRNPDENTLIFCLPSILPFPKLIEETIQIFHVTWAKNSRLKKFTPSIPYTRDRRFCSIGRSASTMIGCSDLVFAVKYRYQYPNGENHV
jgi:hypothetical protein